MIIWQTVAIALIACSCVAALQWWLMRQLHRAQLAAMRERHRQAAHSVAAMLQQSRLQNERTQTEIAELRKLVKPQARSAAPVRSESSTARRTLDRLLDAAPAMTRSPPVDGFADTLPSRQFANTTSFGLLHQPATFSSTMQ